MRCPNFLCHVLTVTLVIVVFANAISEEELEQIRKYGSMVLVRRPKSQESSGGTNNNDNVSSNNNNPGFPTPHQIVANQFLGFHGDHGPFPRPINGIPSPFSKPRPPHRFKFGRPPPPPNHFYNGRYHRPGRPNRPPPHHVSSNSNNPNGAKKPSASVDVFSFGFPTKNSGPKFHRPRGPPPPPPPHRHHQYLPFHNTGPLPHFPTVNPTFVVPTAVANNASGSNPVGSTSAASSTPTSVVNSNSNQVHNGVHFPGSGVDITAHQQLMSMLNTLPPSSFFSNGPPSFGFTPPVPFYRPGQGPPQSSFENYIHPQVPVSFIETNAGPQQNPQLVEYYPNHQHIFVQPAVADISSTTKSPEESITPSTTTPLPPLINVEKVEYLPQDIVAVVKTNKPTTAEESFQQVIFDSVRDSQKQSQGYVAPVYNSGHKPSAAGEFLISHFYPETSTTTSTTVAPVRKRTTTVKTTTTPKPTYHYVRTTIFPTKKPKTTTTTTTTTRRSTNIPKVSINSSKNPSSTTLVLSTPVEKDSSKGPWILRNGKRARRVKKTKEVGGVTTTGPNVSPVYGKKVITRVQSSSSSTSSSSEKSGNNKKRYRLRKVKVEKAKVEDATVSTLRTTPTASSTGHHHQ